MSDVWPTVLDRNKKSNPRNYSIYTTEIVGKKYLFSYFEYVGCDLEADMQAIADDPDTHRWWKETDPCQRQLKRNGHGLPGGVTRPRAGPGNSPIAAPRSSGSGDVLNALVDLGY